MKKQLFFAFILFNSLSVVAQDFTLVWEPEPRKVEYITEKRGPNIYNRTKYYGFSSVLKKSEVKASENLSKVLYVHQTNMKENKENVKLDLTIKDTLNTILKKIENIELPYLNKYFWLKEIFISNDNVIYLYAQVETPAKFIRRTDNLESKLKVFRICEGRIDEFALNPDDKYINDCMLSLGKDNKLRGFGLYSNSDKQGIMYFHKFVHGYFSFEIDRFSKDVKLRFKNELEDELVKKVGGEYGFKKKMGIGDAFMITNAWFREDGGCSVVLEMRISFTFEHEEVDYTANGTLPGKKKMDGINFAPRYLPPRIVYIGI